MLQSLWGSLTDTIDGAQNKTVIYIVIGAVVIAVISVLLDGIKKIIRGLDIAALGALLYWLGLKAEQTMLFQGFADTLTLIGFTLVIVGVLIFIILKVFRRPRRRRKKD